MTHSIFALSTAPQTSALHIHRLSGEQVFHKLKPFLVNIKSAKPLFSEKKPQTRYGLLLDEKGDTIDDIVVSLFCGPYSYTGEDLIEISSHGNPVISRRIATFLRTLGLRDAKPGEFTQRAFLNGKMDMVQAESIHELITAENQAAVDLARQAASGQLSEEIQNIRRHLISLLSYLEAHIDFAPDEVGEYEPQTLLEELKTAIVLLKGLVSSYQYGEKIRKGISLVLFGEPNAGKSSLYNSLLKSERAIVTPIPGTTRDVLKENLFIEGKDFVLMDTAGIRQTEDLVEQIGVKRSQEELIKADIPCLIFDPSTIKQREEFLQIIHSLLGAEGNIKPLIFVFTKKDLLTEEEIEEIQTKFISQMKHLYKNALFVFTEKEQETIRIQELISTLKIQHDNVLKKPDHIRSVLISERQRDKAALALDILYRVQSHINSREFPEKIASDIHGARRLLEETIGEISLDSVYDHLFSSFCIGK